MSVPALSAEAQLQDWVGSVAEDPLAFVLGAFPWGEPGTDLAEIDGPDEWQRQFLIELGDQIKARAFNGKDPVNPIRKAVSSGHGVGKSSVAAWMVCFIMSTRPKSHGTITANNYTQMQTKTWASVRKWMKMCITSHWFKVTMETVTHVDHPEDWFCGLQSSKEENSEAFAGQHAAGGSSFYIFDEDSGIGNAVHTVAEGGLTDGEPFEFLFGNCTQNSGHFYDACFGRMRSRWNPTIVDSRKSRFTNKEQIKEWAEDYGEDSDFFRVRVLGLPPSASDAQFIDQNRVLDAQKRSVVVLPDEPLVAGADLAWGGGDDNVVRFRRGLDARSIPPIRIKGEFTRDPGVLTNRLADVLTRDYNGHQVSMLFLDSAGIAGPIASRLRQLGHKNVQEVNFGSDSPNNQRRYMRDHMWAEMKDWLLAGAIDKHPELEADLTGPGLRPDNKQRIWLESKETMKKRGVDSPDDGDALALTFAAEVKAPKQYSASPPMPRSAWV